MIDPGGEAPLARVLLFAAAFLFAVHGAEAQSSRFYLRGDLALVLGTPAVETDTDPGSAIASLGPTTINGASALTTPDRADLRVHTIMLGLRYQL